jgi:hypothetical protein
MLLAATVGLLPLSGPMFGRGAPTAAVGRWRAARRPLVAGAFVALLVLLWAPALRSASAPPATQVLETRIASRVARLPWAADSLLITERPPVVAAAGPTHVMATEEVLRDEAHLERMIGAGRPVYFLCDMYCEPGFQGFPTPALCGEILARFALSPVIEETLDGHAYVLYRVSGTAGGGPGPRRCPRVAPPDPQPPTGH